MIKKRKTLLPALSKRMQAIVSLVDPCDTAADIGCDHGYVAIHLCGSGICKKCIAADIGEGPAARAKKSVEEYGLSDRIDVRVGDGLDPVEKGEASCIIIAGMGGETIVSILGKNPEKVKKAGRLVLGPQSETEKVRRWLCENGFHIRDERFTEDGGKYYPLLKAEFTGKVQILLPEEYRYGPVLLKKKDEVLFRYLKKRMPWLEKILEGIEKAGSVNSAGRYEVLMKEFQMIKKVLEQS